MSNETGDRPASPEEAAKAPIPETPAQPESFAPVDAGREAAAEAAAPADARAVGEADNATRESTPQVSAPQVSAPQVSAPAPEAAPAAQAADALAAEPVKAAPEAAGSQPAPSPAAPDREPKAPEAPKKTAAGLFSRRSPQAAQQTLQPEAPPAPPPKKKKRREGTLSALSGFLSFVLVALVAGVFGVIAVLHRLKEPGPLGADKVVYLPQGTDLPEKLAREGVIDSPGLMNFALILQNARGKLNPGEYLFKKNVSLREVIDELVAGRQLLHSFTVPEGLTSEQIAQRLRDSTLLEGDILETPKEGALLPETYKFPRGFPRSKLIAKMRDDQRKLVDQIWAKRARDLPLRSPYDLVTLASIVEKETGKAEERPRVAAVFMNRLRKGMRLQSDPTIVYGLVGGKATLGRGILRAEIEKWTPYNTYAIDGLPPGPIANPGKAALEATANPAHTKDLYFVADGTGGHVFAESLDQHARNVQNWRRLEQDQKLKPGEETDQSAPGAVAPAAPRNDKRTQAPIGRLLTLNARNEDYPVGGAMAPDDGATHRLGKFGPAGAAFLLGGLEDPTAAAAAHLARARVARPYFTEEAAQPKAPTEGFDPAMLAARAPAADPEGEEGAIGPDMLARESADGKALPEQDIASYPVSPVRRAEQKARAARLGLSAGSDELPADALGERAAAVGVAQDQAAPARVAQDQALALAPGQQRMRPRAFDASEGTALDPLRDRSWDLTSAKTVPATVGVR